MEDSGEINQNHGVFPDWHVGFQPELREGAIRKIMDNLMEICSRKPNVDKQQIRMGAEYFEAKAYHQATSKDDYMRKIYLMLLSFKRHKEDNILVDPPKSNFSASPCLQPQIGNQERATSQSPSQQSILSQGLQNSTSPIEVQGAAGLPFNTESTSNLKKYLFEQRQRQGRQLQSMGISHHQKQSLCQGYYPYQIQQQTLKQNDQQPSNLQSHVQQQTQQQYEEAQVHEWSCLQTLHPGKFNIQLDHLNPVQPSGISVLHQLPPIAPFQRKPTSTFQQPAVTPQPHPCNNKQPYMPKQVQQIQMATLQQTNLPDLRQQALSFQQQDISSDLLGPQDNIPRLQQQQQLLGTLHGVSNIQEHQNLDLLAQLKTARQREEPQRTALVLLQSQGHQARHQSTQPPTKAQQPPQPHTHQQRFQSTGTLPNFPGAVEQKRKHIQLLGGSSTSPTSLTAQDDTLDLIEEIHQKIKEMKEIYYRDLLENLRKIVIKLYKLDAFPSHQKNPDERRRLIESRDFVQQALYYLGTDKEKIQAQLMERLIVMEQKIRAYLELPPDKSDKIPLGQKESRHPGGNVELARQHPPCGASMAQNINHHANRARQMNWRGSSISADEVATLTLLPSGAQLGIPKASGLHLDPAQGGSQNALHRQPIGFSHQVGMGSIQNSTFGIYNNNTKSQLQRCVNPFQASASASASAIPPIPYPMQPQKQEEQSQLVKQLLPYYRTHLTRQSNRQQQQLQQQMSSELGQQQAMNLRGHHVGPFNQMTEANALKTKQDSGNCLKQFSTVQHNHTLQLQGVDSAHVSSPQKLQASSLQISQTSLGNDWIKLLPALHDHRISSQPVDSLLIMKSPSIPSMSVLGPEQQQLSEILSPSNAGHNGQQPMTPVSLQPEIHAPGTSAMSTSSMTVEYVGSDSDQVKETTEKSSKRKRPTEFLIKAVQSAAPEVLDSSIKDIASVFDLDILSSSAPGNGQNLVERTKGFMSAQNYKAEVWSSRKKIRRDTSSMPFIDFPLTCGQPLEFAAPSTGQCQGNLVTSLVQNEIKEINKRLIDTVVSVSKEEVDLIATQAVEGMVVSFAFTAVSISPNLIAKLASQRMTPIMFLRLLVPLDYPKSSPVLLDKLPDEQSKESGDLPSKAMLKFNKSLSLVSQPISLSKMAKLWDASIRELMLEYAHHYGGGSFSSRVASWQTCVHQ